MHFEFRCEAAKLGSPPNTNKQIIEFLEPTPNDFIKSYPKHLCEYADEDLATKMICFSNKVDEYNLQIGEKIQNPGELENSTITTFPRTRKSVSRDYRGRQFQYLETQEGNICRTQTDVWDWMDVYCAKCQGRPRYITTPSSILVPEKSVLPSLVRRALHLKNMGNPQWKYVFICDNTVSNDVLFTKVREYKTEANSKIRKCFSDALGAVSIYDGKKINSDQFEIKAELWKKKDSLRAFNSKSAPDFLLHLTVNRKDYYASKDWVAVKNNGQYTKLSLGQDSINTLLSKIILPETSTNKQDKVQAAKIIPTNESASIPYVNQYDIHELMIIRK